LNVFWFSIQICLKHLILRRAELYTIKNVYRSSRKVSVIFFSDFKETLIFLDRVSKNTEISNVTKVRLEGAELLHADGRTDGQTDMTKLIVAFRNFVNESKKEQKSSIFEAFSNGICNTSTV
jgi:hypothetical protein